jgi:hypothetical protein
MMLGYMHQWVEGLGVKKRSTLERLTKRSVRDHKNVLRRGESGVSQALVNPLGLPTLEDLTSKLSPPPPGVNASIVGTHQGKPVYFSADAYGKGRDDSPVSRGSGSSSLFSPSYAPSIADSKASSEYYEGYQWTPGLSREREGSMSESTEDFYSAQASDPSPATSSFYSPSPDPPQSTEDFYSARPNLQRSVTTGYIPPQQGPSQSAQDFYSSPGTNQLQFQSPVLETPQPTDVQPPKNPFLRQMSSPVQPQSRGMEFYAQGPLQGRNPQYNSHPPQMPQMSSEAASFYGSPSPQPPQPVSQLTGRHPLSLPQETVDQDGQTDPLAELTASLRKF